MRSVVLPCAALAAVGLVFAFDLVGDAESRHEPRKPLRIVFIGKIGSGGEKNRVLTPAAKSRIAAIRQELAADTALSNKLRARGVDIRKIIDRQVAIDGRTVFYVR